MREALANDIALVIRITKRARGLGPEGNSCLAEVHASETSISATDEGRKREEGKKCCDARWKKQGKTKETESVLCVARFSSMAAATAHCFFFFFFHDYDPPQSPLPRCRRGFSSRRRRREGEGRKTFRAEAGEISLASLRFGIHGSWGALRTWFSAKESELLFPLIQLRLSTTRRAACKEYGEYLLRNPRSVGNPTPCSRVSLRNLVAATLQADFFTLRGFHSTSAFLLIL